MLPFPLSSEGGPRDYCSNRGLRFLEIYFFIANDLGSSTRARARARLARVTYRPSPVGHPNGDLPKEKAAMARLSGWGSSRQSVRPT